MPAAASFPGFSSPAVGPEDPMAMLSACHERVLRQCATLTRLAAYLRDHAVDANAADAAAAVIQYFEKAAPHHHADEEVDLFPLLRQRMDGPSLEVLEAVLQQLEHQHESLNAQWAPLHAVLSQIAAQQPVLLDAAAVEGFVSGYRAHLAIEDEKVFPLALQVLTPQDLQTLGVALSKRRGLLIQVI
jgi:hemerythrin-like domain-containing protein